MAKTYDTYKDSGIAWIGEIPGEWRVDILSLHLYDHCLYNNNLKENNLLSLSYGRIIRKDINTKEGLLPSSFNRYNIIDTGDIVLRLTDLQNDKKSLRTGLCKERGIITSAYLTLRNRGNDDSSFLHYLLHTYDLCKVFYGMGNGVRQGMNYSDVRKIKIPCPPLSVQQSISSFLDTKCGEIDSLISIQEEMISELLAYKQSVITEAVTKGLDKKAKMKNSGVEWIGDIPEEWEIKPYKAIFYTEKGLNITKADLVEKGEPVLSYGQIHSKMNTGTKINDALLKYVPSSYIETNPECLVQKGCFLIADTSEDYDGCGNAIYVDKDMTLFAGYHTIVARPIHNNGDYKYLAYLFLTDIWRQQIRSRVSGIKVYSINQKIIRLTSVLLPPLPVQQAIATYLDEKTSQIDSLIALKQSKIESLKEYKKSIIYEYVTGKKRV